MSRFSVVFFIACHASNDFSSADLVSADDALAIDKAIEWKDGEELSLLGVVSLPAITALLADQGLVPVVPPGLPPGIAILALSNGHYATSNYGPYSDSFAGTLAARPDDPPGTANWYFFNMTNSSKLANDVSNRVWGFAMERATTEVKITGNSGTANTPGRSSFTMGDGGALSVKPQTIDAFAYTPVTLKQTKYPVWISGTVHERPFNPAIDSFTVEGTWLSDLGFQPTAWNIFYNDGKLSAPVDQQR